MNNPPNGLTMTKLSELPRWIPVKLLYDKQKAKTKKLPVNLNTFKIMERGKGIDNWERYTRPQIHKQGKTFYNSAWHKYGLILRESDGIVVIDIDNAWGDGEINPTVLEVIEMFNSYTEISYSGNGVHIILQASMKRGSFTGKIDGVEFEIFSARKKITITGDTFWEGEPDDFPIEHRQKELDAFLVAVGYDFNERPYTPKSDLDIPPLEVGIATLNKINPHNVDYRTWVSLIAAMYDAYGDACFVGVESWADGKDGEIQGMFNSFREDRGVKSTYGTVVYWAKKESATAVNDALSI